MRPARWTLLMCALQVGECVANWWRPDFEAELYPYVPPHITRPKESKRVFVVHLPEKCYFAVRQRCAERDARATADAARAAGAQKLEAPGRAAVRAVPERALRAGHSKRPRLPFALSYQPAAHQRRRRCEEINSNSITNASALRSLSLDFQHQLAAARSSTSGTSSNTFFVPSGKSTSTELEMIAFITFANG